MEPSQKKDTLSAQVDFDAFHLGDENKVIAWMGGGGGNLDNAHNKVCFFCGKASFKDQKAAISVSDC